MDVVTHHTTVAGDFALTLSQWLIRGVGGYGRARVHHHGMEVHRRLADGTWASSSTIRSAPTRTGRSRRRRRRREPAVQREAATVADAAALAGLVNAAYRGSGGRHG